MIKYIFILFFAIGLCNDSKGQNNVTNKVIHKYEVNGNFILSDDSTITSGLIKGTIDFKLKFIKFRKSRSAYVIKALITTNNSEPIEGAHFWQAQKLDNDTFRIKRSLTCSTKSGIADFKADLCHSYLVIYYPSYTIKIYSLKK